MNKNGAMWKSARSLGSDTPMRSSWMEGHRKWNMAAPPDEPGNKRVKMRNGNIMSSRGNKKSKRVPSAGKGMSTNRTVDCLMSKNVMSQ